MVGSNRIVQAAKIVNPLGDADLDSEEEKLYRRAILTKALEALQADLKEQAVFSSISE
jgi:glycine reductase